MPRSTGLLRRGNRTEVEWLRDVEAVPSVEMVRLVSSAPRPPCRQSASLAPYPSRRILKFAAATRSCRRAARRALRDRHARIRRQGIPTAVTLHDVCPYNDSTPRDAVAQHGEGLSASSSSRGRNRSSFAGSRIPRGLRKCVTSVARRFDYVITGVRVAREALQERFGLRPD